MSKLKIGALLLLLVAATVYTDYKTKAEKVATKAKEDAEQEEARLKAVGDWPHLKLRFQYCVKQMTISYNEMTKEVSKKTKNVNVYKKLDKAAIGCYVAGLYGLQEVYDFEKTESIAENISKNFRAYDKSSRSGITKNCGEMRCPRLLYPEPDAMAAAIKEYITKLDANIVALDLILRDKLTEVDR
jgi:hypothetical protein